MADQSADGRRVDITASDPPIGARPHDRLGYRLIPSAYGHVLIAPIRRTTGPAFLVAATKDRWPARHRDLQVAEGSAADCHQLWRAQAARSAVARAHPNLVGDTDRSGRSATDLAGLELGRRSRGRQAASGARSHDLLHRSGAGGRHRAVAAPPLGRVGDGRCHHFPDSIRALGTDHATLGAQMDGGGHERGMRSGTLNVPGIVGFGKATEICTKEWRQDSERSNKLRNALEASLAREADILVNGDKKHRLPNVSNICFNMVNGESLMAGLSKNVAVSAGSACMSASLEPSYVLKALGLSDEMARRSLRFSLGRFTTEEEIDYAADQVKNVIDKLKEASQQIH